MEIEAVAGTPAWHAARRGLLTASRIKDALAVLKNGSPSESRRKLMFDLLAERISGYAVDHFVTDAMRHGIENQGPAIEAYQVETGEIVGAEVFVLHPEIDWAGATPDGLVGSDGLLEVKCPTTPKHLAWLMAGEVPEEHKLQMTFQVACTRRQWVDFVSFDPRVPPKSRLFIKRFVPTADEIRRVEDGARAFLDELSAMAEQFEETA